MALPSKDTRTLHSPVIRRCEIQAPATGTVRVIVSKLSTRRSPKRALAGLIKPAARLKNLKRLSAYPPKDSPNSR